MCVNIQEKGVVVESSGFGLARTYREGCAIHPDDLDTSDSWTDKETKEWYKRQLKAWQRDQKEHDV